MTQPAQEKTRQHFLLRCIEPLGSTIGIVTIAISIFGIIMIMSASGVIALKYKAPIAHFAIKQGIHLLIGIVVFLVIQKIPIQLFRRFRWFILLGAIILLSLVLFPFIGISVNGARSWINLGVIRLQPVELAKPALVIFAAGQLRHILPVRNKLVDILPLLTLTILMAILVIAQPDFSGAIILVAICGGLLFTAGLAWRWIALLGLLSSLALVFIAYIAPYRWQRMMSAFAPWENATEGGYQMVNAMIAIGRGGWTGAGLGQSIQKYLYLPEAHTDFLLAITVEELGLISFFIITLLYLILFIRIVIASNRAFNNGSLFGYLCCWGVFWMLACQTIIAIGVNMAVLPTTGITMPLFSYGGSSMLATFAALGLVQASERQKPKLQQQNDIRNL